MKNARTHAVHDEIFLLTKFKNGKLYFKICIDRLASVNTNSYKKPTRIAPDVNTKQIQNEIESSISTTYKHARRDKVTAKSHSIVQTRQKRFWQVQWISCKIRFYIGTNNAQR